MHYYIGLHMLLPSLEFPGLYFMGQPDKKVSSNLENELKYRLFSAEDRSYGIIINSFYELKPDFTDHYRKVFGKKAWHIGPILLYNNAVEDKAEGRGMKASHNEHE
ncbi:hypothetical protein DVH24_021677 [Malus domestica]|uniref:Uncharacterized protein n=1 Tax=Malus domestica TaxID=3750 RepID=A0A498JXE8_MALDO|nr:hypothetical protein DVH24_021677 [Malus domestica]